MIHDRPSPPVFVLDSVAAATPTGRGAPADVPVVEPRRWHPAKEQPTSWTARALSELAAQLLNQAAGPAAPARDALLVILGLEHGRAEVVDKAARAARAMGLPDYCDPRHFVHSVSSAVPGQLAIHNGLAGPTLALNSGGAASLDAIGIGGLLVSRGVAPAALLGGGEGAAGRIAAREGPGAGPPPADGAALLLVAPAAPGGPQTRLASYHRGDGRIADVAALDAWVRAAVEVAELPWAGVRLLVLCQTNALLEAWRRSVDLPAVVIPEAFGDLGGAAAAVGSHCAHHWLRGRGAQGREGAAALVISVCEGRASCLILQRSGAVE
jgi:hypothetical protein